MGTHQLKHLQCRETELVKALDELRAQVQQRATELNALKKGIHEIESEISTKKKELFSIQSDIADLTSEDKPIIVSEHAIIRYLQRVEGLDLDEVKQKILPDIVAQQVTGDGCYPVSTKHKVEIRDRTVVTI